jgi:hypothetical protein
VAGQIIGLCGAAGAGKNTVADMLFDMGYTNFGFADPVYRAVAAVLGVSEDSLRDRSTKERPIEWLGKSPRELLQTLGTEWGRDTIRDDIWIAIAMRQAAKILEYQKGNGGVCLTDVRFANEAEAIKAAGGVVWMVTRSAACLSPEAAMHSSEAGIPGHLIDDVIANGGSLEDLKAAVMARVKGSLLLK